MQLQAIFTAKGAVGSCRRFALLGAALGAVAMLAAGCSSSGGKRPVGDGGVLDGFAIDYRFGDLPQGCPPATGNNKHVGDDCSNGKACVQGLICACETFNGFIPPEDTPCFCTIPIVGRTCSDPTVPADTCGQGATCCSYLNLGSICVPDVCLETMTCPTFTQ